MRNTVSYEWCLEEVDGHDDIQHHHHADALAELAGTEAEVPACTLRLCLIRHLGNNEDGEVERGYAYPHGGQFYDGFSCGNSIPLRFHNELEKAGK